MWSSLCVKNDVLYRRMPTTTGDILQIVAPRHKQGDIVSAMHDSAFGGHLGIQKTLDKIRARYYWVELTLDVERYCQHCETCQRRKGPLPKTRASLQVYNVGAPFERVGVDILGPLPFTANNNRYILVLIDSFTKWPEANPIPDQTAENVAEALITHVFSRFGMPLQLHSDQGRNFESTIFREVLLRMGVEKTRTTALHPQSDGLVERFNRTILDYLAKFVAEHQRDWDRHLPLLLLSYRSAVQASTQHTPAFLIYSRELRLPSDLYMGRPPDDSRPVPEYVEHLKDTLNAVYSKAIRKCEPPHEAALRPLRQRKSFPGWRTSLALSASKECRTLP